MLNLINKHWARRPINRIRKDYLPEKPADSTRLEEPIRTSTTDEEITNNSLENIKTLVELKQYTMNLEHPLKKTAISCVFSSGDTDADLMVIGEAPGEDEDRESCPFIGASGQLLNRMLAAIDIDRKDVYVTNVIPWRPPKNRTPTQMEIDFFRPILHRHIILKNPKYILLLGSVAMHGVLGSGSTISRIRQTLFHFMDKWPVVATFHPSYVLRLPKQKSLVWDDLKFLQSIMNS